MKKLIQLSEIYKNMGARYLCYRVKHEIEKKVGVLSKKHPINPPVKFFIDLKDWRVMDFNFIAFNKSLSKDKSDYTILKSKVERILNGNFPFFSSSWIHLGLDYDWITNPTNGFKYDINKHWSKIPDLSKEAGDIKFVWEKSRFSYLLTLLRYDFYANIDLSQFVFKEIESWIDANPINQGPNWICSQEISLRILNWCFALQYYKNSEHLTDALWRKIQNVIYYSLHHVYHHIDFSRIAVRNNHAITETLFLTLSNVLFPFVPETNKWSNDGKKWFEEEIDYQIYKDGTFLQFSMNYHRVVIQLLSLAISVYHKNKLHFSPIVYEKAYKSLNFLIQCSNPYNGNLPNYGSNDGALFFPLTENDYRDYRPQLNTLHKLLTGSFVFHEETCLEDSFWTIGTLNNFLNKAPIKIENGSHIFENGGYFLIREKDIFTFIKCGAYKDRPSQNDNLHIDIWVGKDNILRDQGSYKYNTSEEIISYFRGCEGHNTLSINGQNQMLKGGRFMWYNWVKKANGTLKKYKNVYEFWGSINAFTHINKNIVHSRKVTKIENQLEWNIEDIVHNIGESLLKTYWHLDPSYIDLISIKCYDGDGKELLPKYEEVWHSPYYGVKIKSKRLTFETTSNILKTTIKLSNENSINTPIL